MGKFKPFLVAGFLLLLVGFCVWAGYRYFSPSSEPLQATGTIEATSVDLTARTSGTIKKIYVEEGDSVKKGQLVAELSRSDLVAQRERDAMALLKAERQLADLLSGAREQEKEEALANVEVARLNLKKAEDELARRELLFEEGGISEEELERYRLQRELAAHQLQAAEARLSLLEAGSRPEVVAAARAEVARCQAVLKASEALLEDLKVHSPLDGVVLSRNYEEGEYVQMGAPLATVADLKNLWIKVYLPTDDLPAVKVGQKVRFTVSGDRRTFQGIVDQIATKGEYTPRSVQTKQERANVVFAVKIRIDNADGALKPGMPADVTFPRDGSR